MNREEHYRTTKEYMRRSAVERDGFYDAQSGAPLRHTVWQKRIRSMVLARMARVVHLDPSLRSVIDVGCGRGDFTLAMACRLPSLERVVGVDFVGETLDIARRAAEGVERVEFAEGNVLSLPFSDSSFDIVTCINVLHHVHHIDQECAVSELARIAKGLLLLEIKNFDSLYYRTIHPKAFGGIEVYPTTAGNVSRLLSGHGYRLTRRSGIFGFSWLSPLDVLVYERV